MYKNLIITSSLLLSPYIFAEKSLHAHEHGNVSLAIAVEKNIAEIDLDTPAESLFGFEHTPKSESEKKIISDAKASWGNILKELIVFPETMGCKTSEVKFEHIFEEGSKTHSEVEASVNVICNKDLAETEVMVHMRKRFSKIKKLKLEVVGARNQKINITSPSQKIKL